MSFKADLKSVGALDVIRNIPPYICYTTFSDFAAEWTISVTDGFNVWSNGLQEKDIKEKKVTILELKEALQDRDVKITPTSSRLLLVLACAQEVVELDLVKLPSVESREELKLIFCRLSVSISSLQDELKDCKKQLEEFKKSSSRQDTSLYTATDLSGVSSTTKGTTRPIKPAGHSIVNPNSKRRKTAGGVVFGQDK